MRYNRQKDIVEYRDLEEEIQREIEASKYDLSYMRRWKNWMYGTRAGLAMATMGY